MKTNVSRKCRRIKVMRRVSVSSSKVRPMDAEAVIRSLWKTAKR